MQGLQGKGTPALKQEEKTQAQVKKGRAENLSRDTRMCSFDKHSAKFRKKPTAPKHRTMSTSAPFALSFQIKAKRKRLRGAEEITTYL